MPFNPQVFDIGGDFARSMGRAGEGISRGFEKFGEHLAAQKKAVKDRSDLTDAYASILEKGYGVSPDETNAMSFGTLKGSVEALSVKQGLERYRDTLKQQAIANQYDVLREQAQEKRWADSLNERTLSRLDAADARVADFNLRRTEGDRNYGLALDKFNQDKVHYGSNLMGEPYAATLKDGQFHVYEKGDGASGLSEVDFDENVRLANESIARGYPRNQVAAMFKAKTGKDLPISSQPTPTKDDKPAVEYPAAITAPTPFEQAQQQVRVKELQARIAEQDRIMEEVKANPKVTPWFTVGSSLGAAPQAGQPNYKYPLRADRERVWGRAAAAKKAMQAELDKLLK